MQAAEASALDNDREALRDGSAHLLQSHLIEYHTHLLEPDWRVRRLRIQVETVIPVCR